MSSPSFIESVPLLVVFLIAGIAFLPVIGIAIMSASNTSSTSSSFFAGTCLLYPFLSYLAGITLSTAGKQKAAFYITLSPLFFTILFFVILLFLGSITSFTPEHLTVVKGAN